MYIDIVSTFL